jgi:hypothetical protein
MKLTRNEGLSLLATLVILALYNVIALCAPFDRTAGFWTTYGFSILSILIASGAGFYALDRDGLKSKFYGLPILPVVWGYLVAQIAIGFVFMSLPAIPLWVQITVNSVILAVCLVGLIAADIGSEEIGRIDERIEQNTRFIKSLQSDVENLAAKTSDSALKKSLKELAETVKYSDPMSSLQLTAIENEIEVRFAGLGQKMEINGTESAMVCCAELQQLLGERNRKCKSLK